MKLFLMVFILSFVLIVGGPPLYPRGLQVVKILQFDSSGNSNPYPSPQVYPQPIEQSSRVVKSEDTSIWGRFSTNFKKDILANSLAVGILVGMVISIFMVLIILIRGILAEQSSPVSIKIPGWVIPLLIVIGLGIAGYLTFIEAGKRPALCGPVGNCNEVQNSPYAKLFGVLPVGVLGLIGYVAILVAWIARNYGSNGYRVISNMALWGLSLFGVAFSIYLTFLEPFVIGATCIWCLSSAIVITVLLWVTTPGLQDVLAIEEDVNDDQAEPPSVSSL